MSNTEHYTVVIIGSGFGGAMTALSLAREFQKHNAAETDPAKKKNILILERGTWWTTPVGTIQDKEVLTYNFLVKEKQQPAQYWSSHNSFKGFLDIATRCLRRGANTDGLLDMMTLGPKGIFGLFRKGDGVSILRANGVGGGSLVYSNITIRPPDLIFNDSRWPLTWSAQQRHDYYNLAREAIGTGIVYALNEREAKGLAPAPVSNKPISGEVEAYAPGVSISIAQAGHHEATLYKLAPDAVIPKDLRLHRAVWLYTKVSASGEELVTRVVMQGPFKINPGLSNIVTRSARLFPNWAVTGQGDPFNPRGLKRLPVLPEDLEKFKDPDAPAASKNPDPKAALWIDRARVFQTAVSKLTTDYGAVDLAIGDIVPEPAGFDPKGSPKNYCERQGRCNIGCLPGARHTLNKQLMAAILGRPNPDGTTIPPMFQDITLEPLSEVDYIEALPTGGYRIHFDQQERTDYIKGESPKPARKTITADKVIVAAGCVGTNEIMLRSKERGLPNLSDEVGNGFSTNGDYIAFMEKTKERVRLTRGPVTTSFGHFNNDDPGDTLDPDKPKFHTLEDQGIPPAFSSLVGVGLPLIRSLAKGRNRWLFLLFAMLCWLAKQLWLLLRAPFKNHVERQELFKSDDEVVANMMCVVAMGRESAVGKFRLGGPLDTTLRVRRTDGKHFHEDPIYKDIEASLNQLAQHLKADGDDETGKFVNPFLTSVFQTFKVDSINLSHPLGGCRMARSVTEGVVDEYGRVFDKTGTFYEGLYIADASIIPTALGVNPSLTIAALSLRIADHIIAEM